MSIQEDIGDTLALVNLARAAFGQDVLSELPDSRPGQSSDCLYFRALADIGCTGVSGHGGITFDDERKATYVGAMWGAGVEGRTVRAPKQFAHVIEKFDHKALDHYNTTKKKHF